jgi:cell division septation protein DedD
MSPRTYEEELTSYERSNGAAEDDHDLTLGTPTIVGLFFVLTLVCGCFFGLGYAMGHRSTPATPQVFGDATAAANGAAKPTAGSASIPDASSSPDASAAAPTASSGSQTATVPLNAPAAATTAATPPASTAAPSVASAPAHTAIASPAPQSAAAPGTFVVQVAAVSSQDVANILLSTLQKKGYAVTARHEPQDQLLHIQIGPFPDRKDAEAMRQRVLADGFNAIVK